MANTRVKVNRLREGMIIDNDVYAGNGTILIAEGTPLTKEMIRLLTRHFVEDVLIRRETEASRLTERKVSVVDEKEQEFRESFRVAEENLADNLKEIVYGNKPIDVPVLLKDLNGILDKSGTDREFITMLSKMKENLDGLYAHAINVSLFAQILAKWAGCTKVQTEIIAAAGILHDIGLIRMSEKMQEKFSYRAELEGNLFEKHVIDGYNLIRNQDINPDIKQTVLVHHERADGTGYPLQVNGNNISKEGRILTIADVYDTYTMGREGEYNLSIYPALRKMEQDGYQKLDANLLNLFMLNIVETTIQRKVQLSNGEIGTVIMINKYDLLRPMIKVGDAFVDLSKKQDVFITDMVD